MAARLTEAEIEAIARRIVSDLDGKPAAASAAASGGASPAGAPMGIHPTVNAAVEAARKAQPRFVALPLRGRAKVIEAIRATMRENGAALAKAAWEETGLGRYEDKVVKNALVTERTPGLEDLYPSAVTGDHGLSLIEPAPFGVIGALTPSTNPTSTIICNAIGMLAAGNAVVFSVHPSAKECSIRTIALLNKAIVSAGGPPDVVTGVSAPSLESAQEVMKHPGIRLLVVTGGGAVVRAAMASGKRAICAGPGNPPAVVDASADIENAARCIIEGAAFDNNLLCLGEKEVFVEAPVYDAFMAAVEKIRAGIGGTVAAPLGILLTLADYRLNVTEEIGKMIRGYYGRLVFKTEIRGNVRRQSVRRHRRREEEGPAGRS